MPTVRQEQLFREEEKLKDKVYNTFDTMSQKASSNVDSSEKDVEAGRYEDQDAFVIYGQLSRAQQRKHEVERLVGRLYDKPYFSHVRVRYDDGESEENYFLSDSESLDTAIQIGDDGMLLPFKQDSKRPVAKALFHCYQAKKGDPISYTAPAGVITIIPQLICDTDVEKRKLLNVIQLYPTPEDMKVTADEMLDNKLQDNRDNPTLQNIISTLQLQQFEIISADVGQNFVVQGCAGSGKSQCLLHRLFFLRDVLEQDGWEKVLLLTPTKLFRQYSADLMRRYQLSDIYNCSIADLYRRLLAVYDDRFKDRQYIYQMTEEYLPDGYLHEIYDEENVSKIEAEIDKAIYKYVSDGCNALGRSVPEVITSVTISDMVNDLDIEIKAFDEREEILKKNEEYQKRREEYERLLKNIDTARKKQKRFEDELDRNLSNQQEIDKLLKEVESCEKEKTDWIIQREKRIQDAVSELDIASRKVDRGTDLQAPAKYARQLYLLKDLTEGERYKSDEEELSILNGLVELAKTELKEATRDNKPKSVLDRYKKRQLEIEENIRTVSKEIDEMSLKTEEYSEWLRLAASEYNGQEAKITLIRSEMQQSRYFLSRIESTIFEREVWNALSPVKEKYEIQTLEIEELSDGKHKESRILYKADLLFYIRIYMKLHPNTSLPDYGLICIDEGQDLHRADYDILHGLYPNAVFNVFGDVAQVLHSASGISEWKSQTGINTVYPLKTNYRNTAAIVDFCNKEFGVEMNYIGNPSKSQKPVIVSDWYEAQDVLIKNDVVVIVKDKDAYTELCDETGIEVDDFVFLDTLSEKPADGQKECYSIFAAKGLEFSSVFVYAKHMTMNQKVVACTRAMGGLYYYE